MFIKYTVNTNVKHFTGTTNIIDIQKHKLHVIYRNKETRKMKYLKHMKVLFYDYHTFYF